VGKRRDANSRKKGEGKWRGRVLAGILVLWGGKEMSYPASLSIQKTKEEGESYK